MSKCPHCNAPVYESPLATYCMKCGKLLEFNTCSDSNCFINSQKIELPEFALYCPICGKETTLATKEPF
ncbi:hypothetical protein [Clostridium culturomicium]|uniref:hypothetical protein n=1 Tax=Clostridium culturomicium TaxID=1499683 RepID=UPI0005902DB8|nr:hypothetical protein [Clostridium culturomicium]